MRLSIFAIALAILASCNGNPGGAVFSTADEAAVQAVAFCPPDGARVAIACDDNVARLWRPAAGQSLQVFEHEVVGSEAVYTEDGHYVLIKRKDDDTAFVRDAATGRPLCTLLHPEGVRALAVSPDRSLVLTGGTRNSRLFDAATGALLHAFPHANGVWSVAFSPDGKHTLAGGFDGTAQLRDAHTGAPLRELPVRARIQSVAFGPDGERFILGCGDKLGRIFSTDAARPPAVLTGHLSAVNAVAFSRDGRRVASGGFDNTVRIWDAATGEPVSEPMRHRGPVWYSGGTAFSPDGTAVVTACDDGTARVWDIATARPVGPALPHESGVRMVAFPTDTQVWTGTTKGMVRFWGAERSPLRGTVEHIRVWVEVTTGSELDDDGSLRALDGHRWRERRARLRAFGGAPE